MPEGTPQCLDCGACCFSALTAYVRVDGDDYTRLGDGAEALTLFVGNRCYMRMFEGHCASLVPDPVTHRLACSIYGTRPEICRALARSSPECDAEIHEKHDRPPLAIGRSRAAADASNELRRRS